MSLFWHNSFVYWGSFPGFCAWFGWAGRLGAEGPGGPPDVKVGGVGVGFGPVIGPVVGDGVGSNVGMGENVGVPSHRPLLRIHNSQAYWFFTHTNPTPAGPLNNLQHLGLFSNSPSPHL